MARPIRLSVIGAGSATFSLGLVKDICLTESLRGSEISFMDIDQERLEMISKLAERYAKELGSELRFEHTTDRRASLKDADFVINTASVVPYRHGLAQRDLAVKHGYYWGGPPGSGDYAYYNVSFMMQVARDMEQVCPNAWLIQSGNPVFEGCTMMTRETGIKVCGLCHGHYGYRHIAEKLGLDWRKITWEAPGLNHDIWLTHFLYEGQDAYPLIDQWIAEKGEEYWNTNVASLPVPPGSHSTPELRRAWDIDLSRAAAHMYRMFGLMPIGDTVWARYVGWWYHDSLEFKKYWFGEPWGGQNTEASWTMYVENLERHVAEIAKLAQDPNASIISVLGSTKTHEQQVPIIDGLVNNHEGYFQVNVPNKGALPGLPDDLVVEVPALVNAKGIQPIRVEPLPQKIMYEQILPHWLSAERTLYAIKSGDRSVILWQLLDHHQTRSYQQACDLLEALYALDFNKDLAAHYQWPKGWIG